VLINLIKLNARRHFANGLLQVVPKRLVLTRPNVMDLMWTVKFAMLMRLALALLGILIVPYSKVNRLASRAAKPANGPAQLAHKATAQM